MTDAPFDLRAALEATSSAVTSEGTAGAEAFRVSPPSVAALARAVAVVRARGLPVRVRGNGDAPWAPPAGGVLLDVSALDRVSSLDAATGIARVEAGCSVAALEAAARRAGSTLGPLLPSVRAGSVGAWLAGPTRGDRGIPGSRRETAALSVTAILADGRVAESRAVPRSATGPDLDHLSLGGEARLSVIAAAWIRLLPSAPTATLTARAKDGATAVRALQRLCADRLAPSRARVVTAQAGGARLAASWEGPLTAARDRDRSARVLVAIGCTPETEDAESLELARAAALADEAEVDANWVQLESLIAGSPAAGADFHFVGLHAGGAFASLLRRGGGTDGTAKAAQAVSARVIAPSRLRDEGPGWDALGAGKAWTRLIEALGVGGASTEGAPR